MQYKWVAPMAALVLAGCGSENSKDFTIAVEGQRADVIQRFANLRPGFDLPGLAPVTMDSDGPSITFTIPSDEGYDPAEVRMDFAQNGKRTMIDVSVDVPMVMMGGTQYLSEEKVEDELEKNLREWSERYPRSVTANLNAVESTIGLVAVAAQRIDVDDILMPGNGDFDFAAWESEDSGWGDDSSLPEADYGSDGGWGSDTASSDDGWGSES